MTDQEINEAVARKLGVFNTPDYYATNNGMPKDYCHDIKAAWEIVENSDYPVSVWRQSDMHDPFIRKWHCSFGAQRQAQDEADTAPMAICLAFLKL